MEQIRGKGVKEGGEWKGGREETEGEKEGPGPTSRHVKVGSNFRDRAT